MQVKRIKANRTPNKREVNARKLYARICAIRHKLPLNWKAEVHAHFGEKYSLSKLYDVWHLRSSDEELTTFLEELVK